jgi:hypothetical protein
MTLPHVDPPKSKIRRDIFGERPLPPLVNAPVVYRTARQRRAALAWQLLVAAAVCTICVVSARILAHLSLI